MLLDMSDDAGHRRFQFLWTALTRAQLRMTLAKMATAHALMGKLSLLSRDDETPRGTGRVLLAPCAVDLTEDERGLVLEAITQTGWQPTVVPHVRDLCVWLGAELVEDTPIIEDAPGILGLVAPLLARP